MEYRRDVPGGDLRACTASGSGGGQKSTVSGAGVWPGALAKGATMEVSIFLLGDGVVSGLRMQCPADASYNVQEMLRLLAAQGVSIGACRTCLEARGIDDASLVAGINRRTLDDLRTWTEEATKVLVF